MQNRNNSFECPPSRQHSDSLKWQRYGEALPLWVADMDFAAPPPVLEALQQRIAHGIFGYGAPPDTLSAIICERLAHLYQWEITPEDIVYLPGLVSGLNIACRAVGEVGDAVIVQTPVYPPFLSAPLNQQRQLICAELDAEICGATVHYRLDAQAFAAQITPRTKLFILCHPHNPIGRGFTKDELSAMADICERDDLTICSDEIHCDLLLNGQRHQPLATLAPQIAQRCITLMAPSKTFNIPGLGASFAVIQNPVLRQNYKQAMAGIVPDANILGLVAAQAAYQQGADWLRKVLIYLAGNRNYVVDYIAQYLPEIRTTIPEATYLAWLDCRNSGITGNPHQFFLRHAGVAMNDGATFGVGGAGFVRLNFACSRTLLTEGLERMRHAMAELR